MFPALTLARSAQLLDRLTILLCALLIGGGVAVYFHPLLSPLASAPGIDPVPSELLTGWARWANCGLYAMTASLLIFALLRLRRTFRAAMAGDCFSEAAVRGFRGFAWAMLWLVPVRIVQQALHGLLLTSIAGDRPSSLHVTIGAEQVTMAVSALLVLFVAQIFVAGRALDDDARSIL
ncbi:MAG: DUF2975 domain-containing protein [Pseudomonadota bacterium]|uniref:DUF2975 domain-containing protein n=1 Tax=Sphingomonas sp. ERG5 TaxID=1381597 RepID=UPI000A9F66B4|nr:DUF2975 domain-containing protein [Sphingomonas sp. ERG5]